MDEMRRIKMREKFALGMIGFILAIIGSLIFVWAMYIAPYQIDNDVTPLVIGGGLFVLLGGVLMTIAAYIERNND